MTTLEIILLVVVFVFVIISGLLHFGLSVHRHSADLAEAQLKWLKTYLKLNEWKDMYLVPGDVNWLNEEILRMERKIDIKEVIK